MDCNNCTDAMKISRGCNGKVVWKIGPYDCIGCPEKLVKEYYPYINMWQDWKIFGLPFPGHWSEQPKYIIDVIKTLENESIVARRKDGD